MNRGLRLVISQQYFIRPVTKNSNVTKASLTRCRDFVQIIKQIIICIKKLTFVKVVIKFVINERCDFLLIN